MINERFEEPEIDIKTLPLILEANFPSRWREVEACLATLATLFLEDIENPTVLNLVGPPSSLKTTILGFFRKTKELVYFTDKFTPKSFVSCYANAKAKDLAKIDLLPRLRHKIMIVPELAPIFRARHEDLVDNISILTRVFDGEGLWVDSGTTGGRGYEGDYMFCWLGATTPIEHNVWKVMGQLGSRMFFLSMGEEEKTIEDLTQNNGSSFPFKKRREECQWAVDVFLKKLLSQGGIRSVKWDRERDDQKALRIVANLAKLLSRLRGTLQIWSEGQGEGETYVHRRPIIEQPERANTVLYNFARGRAVLYGRNFITVEDIPMVTDIAFSSMPDDRHHLFQSLFENDGIIGTGLVSKSVECSPKVAKGLMEQFIALGVAEDATPEWNVSSNHPGSDERAIRFKQEIQEWLFSTEFGRMIKKVKLPEIDGVI